MTGDKTNPTQGGGCEGAGGSGTHTHTHTRGGAVPLDARGLD